jgi:hypothetical protein
MKPPQPRAIPQYGSSRLMAATTRMPMMKPRQVMVAPTPYRHF